MMNMFSKLARSFSERAGIIRARANAPTPSPFHRGAVGPELAVASEQVRNQTALAPHHSSQRHWMKNQDATCISRMLTLVARTSPGTLYESAVPRARACTPLACTPLDAPPNERKSHECLNLKGAHVPYCSCHMCSEAVRRRLHRRRIIAATTIAVFR